MLLRIFVLTFFVVVAHSKEIVEVQYSRAVEGEIEECSFMYKEYPGKYLRGVRENSYSIWYNNTSLDACKRLCCFAEDDCLSFSYFKALEICFIMNVTKDHETATIINVSSWVHFQKVFGYDYTTTSYDYETTPLPTTPFRISPGVIPGKNKPDKYAEKPNQASAKSDTKPSHSSTTTPHASSTTVGEEAPDNILDGGSFGGSKSEPILGGKGPEEEEGSGQFTGSPGRPTNSQICPLKCENGGRCERVLINHSQHAVVPFRCLCLEGFYGSNCELQMEKYASSGPADYVIALVCLAIIIVILFVAVLIAFYFNRHKTGKYRVRKEKERWNRKRKMRGNQHFIPSPMGSLATSEGSVRSGSDRSTATLV